ncbi:MAG: S8 family serine peptidase [Frankiaceae bacterium]|nr:S8 family serine peptidase [Frankiaceae bacterium]
MGAGTPRRRGSPRRGGHAQSTGGRHRTGFRSWTRHTRVRASHQEFDYRGRASTSDQFVGWWDFTDEVKKKIVPPAPGQVWDPMVADPYDRNGHGSVTASMVGSRRANPAQTAAAVTWASKSVRADVINISIGSIVPVPSVLTQSVYDAIAAARRAGVLVVVSNGNGFANAGIPGDPGWASWYASSPDVLAVGASSSDQYAVSTDPELTAVFTVTGPSIKADNAYVSMSGTSFASPFVAGFAATVLQAARKAGRSLTADGLELLLKHSATDTSTPPQFEGYGVLSAVELDRAVAHARTGTLPTRPSPDISGTYVEQVGGTLRAAWSG